MTTALSLLIAWAILGSISLCFTAATDDRLTRLKVLTAYTVGPALVAWVLLRGVAAAAKGAGDE